MHVLHALVCVGVGVQLNYSPTHKSSNSTGLFFIFFIFYFISSCPALFPFCSIIPLLCFHCFVKVQQMLIAFRKSDLLPTLVYNCSDIKLHHKVTWKTGLSWRVQLQNTTSWTSTDKACFRTALPATFLLNHLHLKTLRCP